MDESAKNSPCKECKDGVEDVPLEHEVLHLRQHLAERDAHIVAVEGEYIKCTAKANELEEQVDSWREKYERLYDSHKRVQKLNQILEDKLLQMVDKMKGEKSQLTKDIATLSVRLAESKHNCSMLQKENERYKNDMNLAIQLLQCKPDNFVSQKLDSLPVDTQARVSQYVMSKTPKLSSSASTLSKNGNLNDNDVFDTSEYEFNVSASLMSKILEDSIRDTVTKHCDTCTCNKSQNKPFSYNESYYSVSTQTLIIGEMKNYSCLNCNTESKSVHSNMSVKSGSSHAVKIINSKSLNSNATAPLYIVPQQTRLNEDNMEKALQREITENVTKIDNIDHSHSIIDDIIPSDTHSQKELVKTESIKTAKTGVHVEPTVHHKLCDRTKSSLSSKKSSIRSLGNEDLIFKDVSSTNKELQPKIDNTTIDNVNIRKDSRSSMGAVSRTSSVAKSTVSTHKSNTQVGPGPRFCHLRMQAGSKNILLDNAQPDVPPVLYRRQSKCNENSIFKDLNDGMDNFIDFSKNGDDPKNEEKNNNVVVESTLIDVHVDNNYKDSTVSEKTINPALLNISSSPLQPLKTHNFSNCSENNNTQSIGSLQNKCDTDNLLNDFGLDVSITQNSNFQVNDVPKDNGLTLTSDMNDIKIFNFDRYEKNKLASQLSRPLNKIDMSQLHSIENTKISKDLPPQSNLPKLEENCGIIPKCLPAIVNVYPNLTQTHLKVNEKKVFTNEQSTSSLSSDDSAALLQKQQLLRVAEWVEKNLEQQNSYKEPLEDNVSFSNRDSRLSRLTETLNEIALNMPHPVSKYAKSYTRDGHHNWIHNNNLQQNINEKVGKQSNQIITSNIVKETIFPVQSGDSTYTELNDNIKRLDVINCKDNESKEQLDNLRPESDKDISAEELARMEYNVKRFLLSGPHWINPNAVSRSRRTSSKTETDV